MSFLRTLMKATPDECREIGNLVLAMADEKRDAAWEGSMTAAIERFEPEQTTDLKEIYERLEAKRPVLDFMYRDGLSHSQLLEAELKRRGEDRDIYTYLQEALGTISVPYNSDVERALQSVMDANGKVKP